MKYYYNNILLLTILSLASVGFGQIFSDNFDDGVWSDVWTLNDTSSYSIEFIDGANDSEYGLKLTGGANLGHYDGLSATFDASQPDYIGYYVKPQITRAINTNYLVINDGTGTWGNTLIFFLIGDEAACDSTLSFMLYADAWLCGPPVTSGEWHHIEYRNIDFDSLTFDWYINNELVHGSVPFRDEISSVNEIHLYNYGDYGEGFYDEFYISNDTIPNVPTTYVPDDNFEQALIDLGYDDVLDNYVVTDSINSVTYLNVYNDSISDLTGIEAFTALDTLVCGFNQLTELDVSNNTALTQMSIGGNQLTSLDVSSNTALTYLDCHLNQITSLDLSSNTALTSLSCRHNALTELDVSSNTALTLLNGYGNQLTSLDLSNNTALTYLTCNNNQLTYLNMKNGVTDALTTFNATNNVSLECRETLDPDYDTENCT